MSRLPRIYALFLAALCVCPEARSQASARAPRVAPGVEVLLARHMDWLRGKRIGLITNQTGVSRDLRTTIDLLAERSDCRLVALFSPEHGIRGERPAGEAVKGERDVKTGLEVRSLYGSTRRPTPDMLRDIDALLYDIQDIGCRGYTFISTLGWSLEAALAAGKEFIVLDRPDPLGGTLLDGPVIPPGLFSFVGAYALPWVYGMTPGELARWICRTRNLKGTVRVAPLAGWKRAMTYEETGLPWISPSPSVPRADTAFFHAITGALGELGTVSEGVGTALPFELIGAPWIQAEALAEEMRRLRLPGVLFSPAHFTPMAYGFAGKTCQGAQIHISDPKALCPSAVMIGLVQVLMRLYPEQRLLDPAPFKSASKEVQMFDRVLGSSAFRTWIWSGATAPQILSAWKAERDGFESSRQEALIY